MAEAWQNQHCARPDRDKPHSVFVWVLEPEKLQQRRVFVVLICVAVAGFLLQPLPKLWEQMKPHWTVVVEQNPPSMPHKPVTSTLMLLDTKQRFPPPGPPPKLTICYFFLNLPWKSNDCHPAEYLRIWGVLFSLRIANSAVSVCRSFFTSLPAPAELGNCLLC